MSNTNAQEQKIQDQIKEQFQKAFYDTIKHSIQNKNHDHIIRLYVEIQDRLATMLKKDGPTHQRLINDFDIPFFEQRLRNNTTMEEVVPVYIKECHGCLDLMEKDMKEFYENRNHPVVQEMMRRAVGARK